MSTDRAAYRAFIRANHPDAGGDPDLFIAGLNRFRAAQKGSAPEDSRFDRPIYFVPDVNGFAHLTHALRRWRYRRGRPRRVR